MPLLLWGPMLEVGVREIDTQHRKLVDLANELADAVRAGKGKDVAGKILNELVSYTQSHFATEERLMDLHKYPDATNHKQLHKDLVKTVSDFKAKFIKGEATISEELMNFLKDWLTKHIMNIDKAFARDLKAKGVQ
ncbi:bacteriohemerythrin [Trichlorobacter ammonificans]|uniref:Bacteriohemerythrin n=1 Tax=Trichlorobacter ammonificans TaxID=2916410 RepID=A0ABM9DBW4_9BACT|nr:bacteriohemerythrin [Trichlorobacter ammonificans]CAH2032297.1 Bacteriohemerythrin [Trichlorobacter ammonificans]